MRRTWICLMVLAGLAAAGCGGVDKSVQVPKDPDPLPTQGPSAMSGPGAPPAVKPPQ